MGTVSCSDAAEGRTEITTCDGIRVVLPYQNLEPGKPVRVRAVAQDVILATEKPNGLSAVNIVQGRVSAIMAGKGPGVIVQLHLGTKTKLLARITKSSLTRLGLSQGQEVFAIVKASAFDPRMSG